MEKKYEERTILTFVYGSSRFFTAITKPGETASEARSRMCNNPTELIVNKQDSENPGEVRNKMALAQHNPNYDRVVRK